MARFPVIDTDGHVLERQSDNEFPENLHDLREHRELSDDAKENIFYKNAKELFSL